MQTLVRKGVGINEWKMQSFTHKQMEIEP